MCLTSFIGEGMCSFSSTLFSRNILLSANTHFFVFPQLFLLAFSHFIQIPPFPSFTCFAHVYDSFNVTFLSFHSFIFRFFCQQIETTFSWIPTTPLLHLFFLALGSFPPPLPIIASLPCHHSFSLLLHFGLTCTLSSLSFTPSSASAAEPLPFSQEWFTSLLQLPPETTGVGPLTEPLRFWQSASLIYLPLLPPSSSPSRFLSTVMRTHKQQPLFSPVFRL